MNIESKLSSLKENIEKLINYYPYKNIRVIPAGIIHEIGKYFIINLNRAESGEKFLRFNSDRLKVKYVNQVNLISKDIYQLGMNSSGDESQKDEFKLWIYNITNPKIEDMTMV